jgi:hypothetical protein
MKEGGAVELYYDDSKKFETTADGVDVTGDLTFKTTDGGSPNVGMDLSYYQHVNYGGLSSNRCNVFDITSGGDTQFLIPDDATKLTITNTSWAGSSRPTDTGRLAEFTGNGSVDLYYDGTKKFETTATGVDVTGFLNVSEDVTITKELLFKQGTGSAGGTEINLDAQTGKVTLYDTSPIGGTPKTVLWQLTETGGITIKSIDIDGPYTQVAEALGALAIDCGTGNYFTKTIAGNSTFTVSNVPASKSYSFVLELTHTSGTVTWFSGVEWPASTAPTLTAGKTHLFVFHTDNGGTRWRASSLVDYTN